MQKFRKQAFCHFAKLTRHLACIFVTGLRIQRILSFSFGPGDGDIRVRLSELKMSPIKASIYWEKLELEWLTFIGSICNEIFSTFDERRDWNGTKTTQTCESDESHKNVAEMGP